MLINERTDKSHWRLILHHRHRGAFLLAALVLSFLLTGLVTLSGGGRVQAAASPAQFAGSTEVNAYVEPSAAMPSPSAEAASSATNPVTGLDIQWSPLTIGLPLILAMGFLGYKRRQNR